MKRLVVSWLEAIGVAVTSFVALVGACSKMRFTLDDHRLIVQLGKNRRERFLFLGNEQLHHFIN